ncbi:MAG: hypothetical protein R3A10_11250 [Caldilineaceae bacterium]
MTSVALTGREATWRRALTRNGWVLGVWLLLSVLLFWYATLIPRFGQFQVVSISKNSLPLAYLAIGQAIIVIAGGIDLSVGALLLLGNVVAARFMEDQALGTVFAIGFVLIVGIAVLNGLVGYIISVSGVPDIVVTLATSYIWSGVALWILPSPGGGTAPQVRWLFTGSPSGIGGTFVTPILMMLIPAVLVYLFSQRTRRLGLAMYAIGSDASTAARLAGLDTRRTKAAAHAVGGAMAALVGLATVAITGTATRASVWGNATPSTVWRPVLAASP